MAARDFPAPTARRNKLSSGELRALWQRNPTPEVCELLWEICRLQDVARQAQSVVTLARMWGHRQTVSCAPGRARCRVVCGAVFVGATACLVH